MKRDNLQIAATLEADNFRRTWAANSADWSWQVLKFLQGRRRNEISLAEIVTTETYARSTPQEKDSLKFVASQAQLLAPISEEDTRRLIERDDFLIGFVEGQTLGLSNWVAEINKIPMAVQHAQETDAALFGTTYPAPKLFGWIWGERL